MDKFKMPDIDQRGRERGPRRREYGWKFFFFLIIALTAAGGLAWFIVEAIAAGKGEAPSPI